MARMLWRRATYVLRLVLIKFRDGEGLTERGKLFHSTGPALLKARPSQECFVPGTVTDDRARGGR